MKLEDPILIKRIVEAAIMAAEKPLSRKNIVELFDELECPEANHIDAALETLAEDCEKRGYELVRVASGYRFQVKQELSRWVSKLWKEKAPRYSRALLETLSLIAYRQPITRGEIESIRGVAVSSQIIRTLMERDWIKSVGHKDVPGRPAIYATTKIFLDYFNLKSLDQLPPLAELRDLNAISQEFNIEMPPELQEQELQEQELQEQELEQDLQEALADTDNADAAVIDNEAAIDGDKNLGDLEALSATKDSAVPHIEEQNIDNSSEANQDALEDEIATQLTESTSDDYIDENSGHAGYEIQASDQQTSKTPLDC